MKILVACEESQAVTIEFRKLGHEAYSCDLEPCSGGHPEWHLQQDVIPLLNSDWDMLIAFPPCTYLTYAGTRHWDNPGRLQKRLEALGFFAKLWTAQIDRICIENPKGCASPVIAKYSQVIQPYYFGDDDIKTTPHTFLKTTGKATYFSDGKTRNPKIRSKTFPGIAKAMAEQWGAVKIDKLYIPPMPFPADDYWED